MVQFEFPPFRREDPTRFCCMKEKYREICQDAIDETGVNLWCGQKEETNVSSGSIHAKYLSVLEVIAPLI